MLAGPRKKQKIAADPRNKQWADDSNKIGLRLMQKMGWSHGKGLGVDMDGETENIKVVMKADSKGLGFSNKDGDNWIAHQDDFNSILSELHQEHGDEVRGETNDAAPKSIEARSKSSKRRVHYKKFTQGKDLANRSRDDMNCILGRRSGSSTPKSISAPTSDTEEDKSSEGASHGVRTVVSNVSLKDYFAQKMSQRKNGNSPLVEGNSPVAGDSPDDLIALKDTSDSNVRDNGESSDIEKNQTMTEENSGDSNFDGIVMGTPVKISEFDGESDGVKNKKKKRKKRKADAVAPAEGERVDSIDSLAGENQCSEASNVLDRGVDDSLSQSVHDEVPCNGGTETLDDTLMDGVTEGKSKKRKKKKRKEGQEG